MNKTYRSIWNETTGTWVAVQENAVPRGKRSSKALIAGAGGIVGMLNVVGAVGGATLSTGAYAGYIADNSGARVIATSSNCNASNGGAGGGNFTIPSASGGGGGSTYAIGCNATASGIDAIAFGQTAYAVANNAIATGDNSRASGVNSVVYGSHAYATGANSAVVGAYTVASGQNALAVGYGATATNANSVALGSGAKTSEAAATASGVIGGATYSYAGAAPTGVLSVGAAGAERQITNLAAGRATATSTDAVNGSQLYATNSQVTNVTNTVKNIVNGGGTKYFHANSTLADSSANGTNSTAIGPAAVASMTDDVAIGDGAAASRAGFGQQGANIAMGANASAQGYRAIAIGYGAQTNTGSLYQYASDIAIGQSAFSEGFNSVALGNSANAGTAGIGGNNVAVGSASYAKSSGAVALGGTATAGAAKATALGATAYAGADASTALGNGATAAATGSIAIGSGANASVSNSVALGNGAKTSAASATASGVIGDSTYSYAGTAPTGVLSVGATGAERQITNLAAGRVTATSTDAVNGSQLFATNDKVTQNSTDIRDLHGQVTNIAGNVTNINAELSEVVKYDSPAHTSVTLGSAAAPVALHNLAEGTLSASSTDAVNGAQLFATDMTVSNMSGAVTNIAGSVTNIAGAVTQLQGDVTNIYGKLEDAVVYDSAAHTSVTLGDGNTPVMLHNLAAGIASTDAVNVGQLGAAGFVIDQTTGLVLNKGVTYDPGSIEAGAPRITLEPGVGNSKYFRNGDREQGLLPKGTIISNLADGVQDTDAVNVGQVAQIVSEALAGGGGGGGGGGGDIVMSPMRSAKMLTAEQAGAGINTAGLNTTFKTAAWYTQVKGIANASGSTGPTDMARVVGLGSIAMGSNTQSDGNASMALGIQSYAKANDSVALGAGSVSTQANTVSVGSDGTATHVVYNADGVATTLQSTANTRRIVNMAAGQGDTDAVNVAQLKDITDALGSGATVNGDGTITPPSYTAGGTTFHNVGDTLTNIDQRTTQNTTNITQLQGLMADAVSYDGPNHDTVSFGTPGTPVALHNVAPGSLSESSTDAVNGSQLFATNTNLSNLAGTVTNIAGDVTNMSGQIADAVKYDGPGHTSVTLGNPGTPVTLRNVAPGTVTTDAVNVGQLASAGFSIDASSGAVQNQAVTYNAGSAASGSPTITLAPGEGNSPYFRNSNRADGLLPKGTVISNVASGIQDTDAANVGQLWDVVNGSATGDAAPQTMMVKSANVNLLTSSNGSGVDTGGLNTTFKTAAWYTQVKGIANASGSTGPTDMARVVGLGSIAMGSNTQSDGNASMALGIQAYAKANDSVALGAGSVSNQANTVSVGSDGTATHVVYNVDGVASTVPSVPNERRIVNMAAGQGDTDAVNVAQLKGITKALGGGSTVNGDGSIAAPVYVVGVSTYGDVGSAIDAAAASGGTANAVVYDTNAHDVLTLGGAGSSGPVRLKNVANGVADADAINVAQLKAAGLGFDTSGNVTNAFVAYDDNTKNSVTFGGTSGGSPVALHNVKAGAVSSASFDAVNGAQLYGLAASTASALGGQVAVNPNGTITAPSYQIGNSSYSNVGSALDAVADLARGGSADAVIYDSGAHDKVTLGGKNASAPVKLTNVANATQSGDAVNLAQLQAMGGEVDTSGNVTNAFVAYDDTTKRAVTLGGKGSSAAVVIHNVANGAQDADAINVAQLKAAGLGFDTSGNVTNAFVAYDDNTKNSVTLGGKSAGAPVALHNVAPGTVNAASFDAVNGSQLYGLAASTASALGGQAVVNPNGTITSPSYQIGSSSYSNVGSALDAVAELARGGSADAVIYDSGAHNKVTLGGKNASAPVKLTNLANATDDSDAINMAQLKAAGLNFDTSGNVTNAFVAYDDNTKSSVSLGGKGSSLPVALHNVASGTVNAASFDAVNGSQLYGLAALTAAALGGKTTVDPNGSITMPTYVVSNSSYENVGDAIDAVEKLARGGSVDSVMYDSASHDKVTLGGQSASAPVKLTNLANATDDSDAINMAQLKAAGLNFDTSGNVVNGFVAYDDTTKKSVTFGGAGASTPVVLHNVANGSLDNDAINVAQLKAAGLSFDTSGNVTNAFVAYDNGSKSSVTLGGAGATTPVALHNVANATLANDAVNLAQLQAMGAVVDTSGNVTNAFVAYDDASKSSISLGGVGSTKLVKIHNVEKGTVAANSSDAVNGAQLYTLASSVADGLGGGSTVDGEGKVTAPTYNIGGNTYNNVGGALTNIDARVTTLETTVVGKVENAVQYDSAAHDKVTLGGTDASAAVKLTNLADGDISSASSTDAVTGGQLYATNENVAALTQAVQNIGDTSSPYVAVNSTSGPASASGSNTIAMGGGSNASGASSTAIGDKASATGENSVALGANSVADQANTVSVGSAGNERRITNVADGVAGTDAVNMRQFQSGMTEMQRNAYGGIAAATALTMIPDVDQGKTIAVGIGTANYKGYQATALGVSARITQNVKVKMGAGYSAGGDTTWGGGMSYQW